MSLEAKIQALLAHAEPLRPLDEDDPAKAPLAGIVDEINRLRAKQERIALLGPEMDRTELPDGWTLVTHATPSGNAREEGADALPTIEERLEALVREPQGRSMTKAEVIGAKQRLLAEVEKLGLKLDRRSSVQTMAGEIAKAWEAQ